MPATDTQIEHLLADLVRIESVTPWLIPDGAGEQAVQQFIADWMSDLPGVEIWFEEVEPGRPNLFAKLPGAGGGPSLLINSHADTVGYGNWRDRALVPERRGDRLIGLGVADDKSSCAIGMLVLRSLVERGVRLKGDLTVATTVDEEGASIGTIHMLARHKPDAILVLEPERLDEVIVEHQGFGWIDIVVHGRAAHGSDPDQGIDAIVRMAEVITRLKKLDDSGFGRGADGGSMSGRTVFHTGTIHGGTDYATYPSSCVLGIEIGTQPGEHLSDRVREIEAIFAEVKGIYPDFAGEVNVKIDREPFMPQGYEALFDALIASAEPVLGHRPRAAGLNAWGDSGLCSEAGIPTLCYGVDGGNFHAPDEWVSMPEMVAAVQIVEQAVERFCGLA
jgi:acetylornithine deacetylase/succinyl-diaminopimelate desuccinylase-like protein